MKIDQHGGKEVVQLERLTSELTTPTKVSKYCNGDIGGRLALQYSQQIRVILEIAALVTHLSTVTE